MSYESYAKLLYDILLSAINKYTQFMLQEKELRLNFTFQNSWVLSEKNKYQKTNKINPLYSRVNNTNLGINSVFLVLKLKTMGTNIFVTQWTDKHDFKA